MFIVLLLLFQSICRYCQRLVLHVHDRWINPKNVRIIQEAAETHGIRKSLTILQDQERQLNKQRQRKLQQQLKEKQQLEYEKETGGNFMETCRFCVNSPQGYCRHHFHLQELQIHKQQRPQQQLHSNPWNLKLLQNAESKNHQEYKQLRRINRELKRNLKNRFNVQQTPQQQQQQNQQQPHYQSYKYHLPIKTTLITPTDYKQEQEQLLLNKCEQENKAINVEEEEDDDDEANVPLLTIPFSSPIAVVASVATATTTATATATATATVTVTATTTAAVSVKFEAAEGEDEDEEEKSKYITIASASKTVMTETKNTFDAISTDSGYSSTTNVNDTNTSKNANSLTELNVTSSPMLTTYL